MRLMPIAALAASLAMSPPSAAFAETYDAAEASREMLFGQPLISEAGLARLRARGNPDVLPTIALSLRFRGPTPTSLEVTSTLAGEVITSWRDLMLWLEARPDFKPHPSYRDLKLELLERIDPKFHLFLGDARSLPENMDIRLEEIVWGGVRVDGIPSLDTPKMTSAAEADWLKDDDLVFGVEINGDARAYPLRVMGWHEMMNDVIGDVPLAIAYCTLCGAAIAFETDVAGRDKPLIFGSSGFLYRSNKLMFDRETDSLWNQFTGKPVTGPLRGSGIQLKVRPIATTTWARWREKHSDTTVLSLDTGHQRDYGSGVVYQEYFASPDLMFPTRVGDETVAKRKDVVFGVRDFGAARAWPVAAFGDVKVINDAVGGRNIVLVGDADTRTVRAYDRGDITFTAGAAPGFITADGAAWQVEEDNLVGPDGAKLARVPGHLSYWFAWDGYFGQDSTLYGRD